MIYKILILNLFKLKILVPCEIIQTIRPNLSKGHTQQWVVKSSPLHRSFQPQNWAIAPAV